MENNSNLVSGTAGGVHVTGAPATTETIAAANPALLTNSIDSRIVKVRPTATPIDQLSRTAAARRTSSMTVEYYSVDPRVGSIKIPAAIAAQDIDYDESEPSSAVISIGDAAVFEPSDTFMTPKVLNAQGETLMYYVFKRENKSRIAVIPLNGDIQERPDGPKVIIPAMPKGTEFVRMGRAATELDVQTAQFAAIPRKNSNNCQIFKMQVEQSTLASLSAKEASWTFSDHEEAAIMDMRLGMEKSFLFGARGKIFNTEKNEHVYFTDGIWNQTSKQIEINLGRDNENAVIDLCRQAFTGQNGSKHKILVAGSGLIEALSKVSTSRTIGADRTLVKWGIEFKEIRTNFGALYVVHSEVFDLCDHSDDGMIIDPDYLTKYVHIPFQAEKLDLRRSGQRNTDAVVLTEASCLVLRYPNAHARVMNQTN